jgi:hypothetical protein
LKWAARAGARTVYTNNRNVNVRVVASDDTLVSEYLILDGANNPAGRTFIPIPGGPRQNAIFTVSDFVLNNTDGNHTVYGWVKDDKGVLSAGRPKRMSFSTGWGRRLRYPSAIQVRRRRERPSPSVRASQTPTQFPGRPGSASTMRAAGVMFQAPRWHSEQQTMDVRSHHPSGNDGIAVVTVSANDAAGNSVGAHSGNTFVVDNGSPKVVGYPVINYTILQ